MFTTSLAKKISVCVLRTSCSSIFVYFDVVGRNINQGELHSTKYVRIKYKIFDGD